KGAPAIGVAAMYGPPANLALVLPFDTPIKTVGDLKGKRIGVTTTGSLTDWLGRELSRQQGWGRGGIQILAPGQMPAPVAAIQRGELDGMVIEAATGYELGRPARPETSSCSAISRRISTPMSSSRPTTSSTSGRTCCGVSCAAGSRPSPS